MASLQRIKVNGRSYWRIVESRRVNGKPRPVPVMHLGTADALFDRLLKSEGGAVQVQTFQHGNVAALKAAADRLGVVDLIDRHVGRSRHAVSVGTALLLAALNRAVRPRSKRGWAAWAQQTSLPRLFPGVKVADLDSQFFWDQMNLVSLQALEAIEADLTKVVVKELRLELDTLLYDTTNFYTYIDSLNSDSKLTKRGHSKQKRSDLRLFSLALLVSRNGQIPICSRVYEGNVVDARSFPESLTQIRKRLEELSLSLKKVTLVYDRGNNSKRNQALVDASEIGYVAALSPNQHPDLAGVPASSYRPLGSRSALAGTPVMRLQKEIWGATRTVVLFISEQLRRGQIRGLEQHLSKRLKQLAEWKTALAKPRSGPRTPEAAQRRIERLLSGQHVRRVLRVEYHADRKGSDRLEYRVDEAARATLEQEVFGKRILITNRDRWSTTEIISAYRGQGYAEGVFRQLKDDEHLAVRPQFHWTDQKIRVHTFICLLSLLLSRVVEHEARERGFKEGLSGLLELLGTVRLALILRSSGAKGGRPRAEWALEAGREQASALFRDLVPAKPPFVYTPPSA